MTPYEMEEQLKNLDARVNTIGQILPTLATRQDLRDEVARLATKEELRQEVAKLATKEELRDEVAKLATRDDLRLTTDALQLEMAKLATTDDLNVGLEDTKRYTLLLIQATRGEIRQIREEMATKGDLQRLEMATKRDLQQLQRTLSKQIATLRAPGRKKS
jgi:hypothetical protein